MQPHCTIQVSRNDENDHLCMYNIFCKLNLSFNLIWIIESLAHGLSVFGELGASKLLEIMALICPAIKDTETDMIINMDYEVLFHYSSWLSF